MIIYKTKTIKVEKPDKFICDCCMKHISDEMELQETYSIKFTGGYSSVFGDGNAVSCDLCQQCLKDLIGDFCVYNAENGSDQNKCTCHPHDLAYYGCRCRANQKQV